MGVWCTEFSTSFLGLLTSKKMITIILIKNDNIIKLIIIIIIINFSQTFCPFVLSPHIFKSSTSATLIVCRTSCETSQCLNFTQELFCFSLFYSRNSDFLSPQFLNHPRCNPRQSQLHFHSQTI